MGDVRRTGLNLVVDLVRDRTSRDSDGEAARKFCHRCFEKGLVLIFLADGILPFQSALTVTDE